MSPPEGSVAHGGGVGLGAIWSEVLGKASAPENWAKKRKEMRTLQQEGKNE